MFSGSVGSYFRERSSAIPERPIAKLMYYLNTISKCLDLSGIRNFARLSNFSAYHLLSQHEIDAVLSMCIELNPSSLAGKVLIPDDVKCGEFDYVICDSNDVTQSCDHVTVKKCSCRINFAMYARLDWIEQFYNVPLSYFEDRLQDVQITSGIALCDCEGSSKMIGDSKTTYGTFMLSVK